MAVDHNKERGGVIQVFFIIATLVIVGQLLNLQVFNQAFQERAEVAGSSIQLEYPSRGLVFDRNEELLVVNQPIYDLMFIYNQFEDHQEDFDTLKFCEALGVTKEYFIAALDKNWRDPRYSKAKAEPFLTRIPKEQYASLQESLYQFPGFFVRKRNARAYPHRSSAHLLGYIGEVGPKLLEDSAHVYSVGDYTGISGLEHQYEPFLRGTKGIKRVKKDIYGRVIGSVDEGKKDIKALAGDDLFSTIDLELQTYGEDLMQNKIGSIVAIEPATGEILAMISTPTYDPSLLAIGPGRGRNYAGLLQDSLQPFFNRALQAEYPPGSLFKPLVALIGMQVGKLQPNRGISCQGAYFLNGMRLTGCHAHPYCKDVATAIQHSCNAYFVTAFREIIDRYDEYTPRQGLSNFNSYLQGFGMGNALGIDFPGEKGGNVPTPEVYDQAYAQETGWKSIWLRSLGIGQGELLTTNLQLANMAAAIANRGYYYTPHLTRHFRDADGNTRSHDVKPELHRTGIDSIHFQPVIDGMEMVVRAGTAQAAFIPDIPICGKTGTAENNQRGGKDHSIFFAFAPKDNPKIAIAVYVENGGWGGSYAAPIVSLMIERYLKGEIRANRQWLEDRMLNADLIGRLP
ncbi:MAG: penicillin-binding protein 2 [Bacteroidota bacterium]